jgi:hypothetical protein
MNRLVAIDGNRGQGKTSLMVYFLWKNPDLVKEVNFNCNLPNCKRLEMDMLLKNFNEEHKGMIGITESIDLLDNRRSMSDLAKFMYRVTSQSRKIGKDLLIDALILDTIDWRFLKSCDMKITAWGENITEKLNKGFYYECIAKIRQLGYSVNGNMEVSFGFSQPIIKCIPYEVFNQFKDKYNTYEITETDDSENLSVAVMGDKKKREIVLEVASQIMNDREKFGIANKNHISHGEVLSILLDLNKPTGLEYELHAKLNRLIQIEKQSPKFVIPVTDEATPKEDEVKDLKWSDKVD